jgi:hypothetical protein
MRYIKLFENSSSEYFEISITTANNTIYEDDFVVRLDNVNTFTEKEIGEIKKYFNESFEFDIIGFCNNSIDCVERCRISMNNFNGVLKSDEEVEAINVDIVKLNDEWYLASINQYGEKSMHSYYKCDQLDGLKKFLDNEFVKRFPSLQLD